MGDSVGDSSGFRTAAAALLRCFIPSNICSVCCMSRNVSGVWSNGGVIGVPSGLISIRDVHKDTFCIAAVCCPGEFWLRL